MHLAPAEARDFVRRFRERLRPSGAGTEYWFFPSAVSLEATAGGFAGFEDCRVGVQDVHWEPKGAFTGETSVAMAAEAGATAALVGHSERRHVFGETDREAGLKVRAALAGGLIPMLCVGETLTEREGGRTLDVVRRQLGVLQGIPAADLARVRIAYEPVWAIGTGRNATPEDAAQVHAAIRAQLAELGGPADAMSILYGGSVKPDNAAALVGQADIDGLLVGGASLDPESWRAIVGAARN